MQGYGDVEGEIYNYRSNVPGYKKLAPGDYFVYYRPEAYVLFGAGTISEIETYQIGTDQSDASLTDYNAYIESYRPFEPPIKVREIKDRISFLKNREGLRGVPQNSIYEIDQNDFLTILQAADEHSLLQE